MRYTLQLLHFNALQFIIVLPASYQMDREQTFEYYILSHKSSSINRKKLKDSLFTSTEMKFVVIGFWMLKE